MSKAFNPGDRVVWRYDVDENDKVDYGTVIRMGTFYYPHDTSHVYVLWDSDGEEQHANTENVHLISSEPAKNYESKLINMKTITIDGVEYNLVPKVQAPEPLICTLNGEQYFLGPEAPELMAWQEAVDWCKNLGWCYELPSRQVLLACFENPEIREHFAASNYWSSSEFSSTNAWYQNFNIGVQSSNNKTTTHYVRAVKRLVL